MPMVMPLAVFEMGETGIARHVKTDTTPRHSVRIRARILSVDIATSTNISLRN
jgi:hypothetical protein